MVVADRAIDVFRKQLEMVACDIIRHEQKGDGVTLVLCIKPSGKIEPPKLTVLYKGV